MEELEKTQQSRFHTIADGIASLICLKQRAYGDSFTKAQLIMDILYPGGVPVSSYRDMLTIIRILDKLSRIATADDPMNEDPWMDIVGYGLLALWQRERAQEREANNE